MGTSADQGQYLRPSLDSPFDFFHSLTVVSNMENFTGFGRLGKLVPHQIPTRTRHYTS